MSIHEIPSPELEAGNDLINRACKEIQKMMEPQGGRVPKPNLQAALHLMRDVLEASHHLDKANYERVHFLLSWAVPEVAV